MNHTPENDAHLYGAVKKKPDLADIYNAAAAKAHKDGIGAGNEPELVRWIYQNCRFDDDKLFFLVLGIGCALADIEARERGYENGIHEAFHNAAMRIYGRTTNLPRAEGGA